MGNCSGFLARRVVTENSIQKKNCLKFSGKGEDDENKFYEKFGFEKEKAGLVGIERECFITDLYGNIVPRASEILKLLPNDGRFGHEFSACQLEDRTKPTRNNQIRKELLKNEKDFLALEKEADFNRLHIEVAPENMPLDIFPDSSGRYEKISKNMSKQKLLAACRVIGTHIHIGMPNHDDALKVYNGVIAHTKLLSILGDNSNGERLDIYSMVAPNPKPLKYKSWKDFYASAKKMGFSEDPRRCWNLIRISMHGTIEFRMFGSTSNIDKIVWWAKICHSLCMNALK
jgi:gamma-glutamyl:cysteine ligase YbdK (ATP-grasp superfamily)